MIQHAAGLLVQKILFESSDENKSFCDQIHSKMYYIPIL